MNNLVKILLVICLFVFGSVLFRNLDSLSLRMWDESRNAINALEMIKTGNYLAISFEGQPDLWNTKPPLLIWNIAAAMKLIGMNELAVRLPSVIAALITMIAVSFLLFRITGGNIASVAGGLVLCTCPGFIDYHIARNGDFDSMLSMWVFLAGMFYFLWLHSTSKSDNMLYFSMIALAAGLMTKGIASLLMLPGFFIYSVFTGNIKKLVTSKGIYISALLIFVPIISYYVAREYFAPGYVSAVIENELSGRYMQTTEGHEHDGMFYIRNLWESRLGYWKFVFLISLILGLLIGRKKPAGRTILFGLLSVLSYLIIISFSKTKLPWYDALVFPYFALVCGSGIILFVELLEKVITTHSIKKIIFFRFFLVLLIVAYPFYNIHSNTSVKATVEQTYPELFYGDMIKAFVHSHPDDSLSVVFDGYNSHALFYIRLGEMNGSKVKYKSTKERFYPGEIILTCEDQFLNLVKKRYQLETEYENESRLVSKILTELIVPVESDFELASRLLDEKINEILSIPEWKAKIEQKAADKNISLEEQLLEDAVYVLLLDQKISDADADSLKSLRSTKMDR